MKQKSFAMSYYLVVGAIMLLTSCKKGDTGPAGAPGPAGPPGTTGPVGAANVIYSGWFNLDYNPETENGDTVRFVATITAPKLVDSILSKGEIKVYFNFRTPSNPDVRPLPYFDPIYYNPAYILLVKRKEKVFQ